MDDAQFKILDVKLDGIYALLDQRYKDLAEDVSVNRKDADSQIMAVRVEVSKLTDRVSPLETRAVKEDATKSHQVKVSGAFWAIVGGVLATAGNFIANWFSGGGWNHPHP